MTAVKKTSLTNPGLVINRVPIVWNDEGHGYTFFGIDAITFWTKPSLVSILGPLRKELGAELYSLIISYEASKGTFEDYHSMVNTLGEGFLEGFLNWGRAVSTAGWGIFSVLRLDFDKREALVQIDDPWEMKIFRAERFQDSIPFLSGKITGIFSHAFHTNCRCEIIEAINEPEGQRRAVLRVYPSKETLEQALGEIYKNRDVSQQDLLKAANSSLRRNQQRLTDMLDTIGERIWETDPQLNLTYISNAQTDHEGRQIESVIGSSLLNYIFAEDVPLIRERCEELKLGHVAVVEVRARFIDLTGEIRWGLFRFKSLPDASGMHGGFIGSNRDITLKVGLEKQLAEQQQQVIQNSKLASLGEMAAGVAHEINNPLTEIQGSAWHLRNLQKENQLTPEVLDSTLATIENMSRRISKIIKGMRTFSRDAGQDPFRSVLVQEIIADTLIFCKKRFGHQGIDLRVRLLDPELAIPCRPSQIGQVLLNLLNNASDAIRTLPEKWIEIHVDRTGDEVCFVVRDSGRGIPKDIANKIMQPFFTTKPPGQGTGLGLSISRGIVESHHGRLFLDAGEAHTAFVMVLPLRQDRP